MEEKLVVTLSTSELKILIAETIDSRINNLKEIRSALPKVELPKFLTRSEVAVLFRVSLVTIDKWRRYGRLPNTIKQSGRTYFLRKEIEEFLTNKINKK